VAPGGDAFLGRNRRFIGPFRGRVRDGNHYPSHHAGILGGGSRAVVYAKGLNMAFSLILVPLLAAALLAALPSNRWRPRFLPFLSLGHLVLVLRAVGLAPLPFLLEGRDGGDFATPVISGWGGWLVLDPLGKVFLLLVSVLFFLLMVYAPGYLAFRSDKPNRVLCVCLMLSLAMMTLVILSHHLGLMWVGMEATTLATAPG